ncbi:MAG: HypC/HybG/HupF family hydrogenase formation chaperone [Clostridiaceae bacterium]|nr:HypC/HybG/HupF family hydrogenase formation chaperone [Clostridiaceae bacterium]
MCLGIPLKIIEINGMEAIGEMNGVKNKLRIDLLPKLKMGDYVMVHAGFGIEIIDETLALETIETLMELEEVMNEGAE